MNRGGVKYGTVRLVLQTANFCPKSLPHHRLNQNQRCVSAALHILDAPQGVMLPQTREQKDFEACVEMTLFLLFCNTHATIAAPGQANDYEKTTYFRGSRLTNHAIPSLLIFPIHRFPCRKLRASFRPQNYDPCLARVLRAQSLSALQSIWDGIEKVKY